MYSAYWITAPTNYPFLDNWITPCGYDHRQSAPRKTKVRARQYGKRRKELGIGEQHTDTKHSLPSAREDAQGRANRVAGIHQVEKASQVKKDKEAIIRGASVGLISFIGGNAYWNKQKTLLRKTSSPAASEARPTSWRCFSAKTQRKQWRRKFYEWLKMSLWQTATSVV